MNQEPSWDETYDVVVAGSGAAALSAALTSAVGGASVLVVEKSERFGGTSAMSGAGVWVPPIISRKSLVWQTVLMRRLHT